AKPTGELGADLQVGGGGVLCAQLEQLAELVDRCLATLIDLRAQRSEHRSIVERVRVRVRRGGKNVEQTITGLARDPPIRELGEHALAPDLVELVDGDQRRALERFI